MNKNIMRRISLLMIFILTLTFAGCGNSNNITNTEPVTFALSDITTEPEYTETTEPEEIIDYTIDNCRAEFVDNGKSIYGICSITNTGNVDLELPPCGFIIRDSNDRIIHTFEGYPTPEVIAPEETGYYYYCDLYDGIEKSGLTLEVTASPKKYEKSNWLFDETIRFDVTEITIRDTIDYYGNVVYDAIGTLENNTDFDPDLAVVGVVLFDEYGEPIVVLRDNGIFLGAHSNAIFETREVYIGNRIPKRYEAFAFKD